MPKDHTLSLREQWLAESLKKARKRSGYTLEQVADHLQLDNSTLSRFETGVYKIRRVYIKELVDFYGIDQQCERDKLIQLSQDAWRKDWWDGETDDLETGFIDYTWLEAKAKHIRVFTPMLIPGLMQTREYASAIMENDRRGVESREHAERMVELRIARQGILTRKDPVRFSAVLEEAPLKRPIGSRTVLKDQLRHLLKLAAEDHVDLRVLPTDVGWHVGENGPFTYFEMNDPFPDVAYVENLVSRTFLEDDAKVERFRIAYAELSQQAYSPCTTTEYITTLIEELS